VLIERGQFASSFWSSVAGDASDYLLEIPGAPGDRGLRIVGRCYPRASPTAGAIIMPVDWPSFVTLQQRLPILTLPNLPVLSESGVTSPVVDLNCLVAGPDGETRMLRLFLRVEAARWDPLSGKVRNGGVTFNFHSRSE
jgi:hypothetical protein